MAKFLFQKHIFKVYAVLIVGLGFYSLSSYFEKQRQQAKNQYFIDIYNQMRPILDKIEEFSFRAIEKQCFAYKNKKNNEEYQKANSVLTALESYQDFNNKELYQSGFLFDEFDVKYTTKNGVLDSTQHLWNFHWHQKRIVNSLYFAIDELENRQNQMDTLLQFVNASEVQHILLNHNNVQKASIMSIFDLKSKFIALKTYKSIEKGLEEDEVIFDPIFPMMSSDQDCLFASEKFKGQFFLNNNMTKGSQVNMYINDKMLPMENGVGVFKAVYNTSGTKILKSKICIINPLTSIPRCFEKEFKLTICQ
jgi:hypothetical protein